MALDFKPLVFARLARFVPRVARRHRPSVTLPSSFLFNALEAAIRRDAAHPEAQQLERQVKALRFEMTEPAARLTRLQNEEIALGQEIAAEQGRWTEINQRLEELDRALVRR